MKETQSRLTCNDLLGGAVTITRLPLTYRVIGFPSFSRYNTFHSSADLSLQPLGVSVQVSRWRAPTSTWCELPCSVKVLELFCSTTAVASLPSIFSSLIVMLNFRTLNVFALFLT